MTRGEFVVADFAARIEAIPEASLDRIFCISVLEELIDYRKALAEFKRLLKPDGLIILTCDAPFVKDLPTPVYPGVDMDKLEKAMTDEGLHYKGSINRTRYDDLLHHKEWNLAVWHCVIRHG
jgi:ubiquinone/menaquinone biosynthesis C-methylase UbiE